MMQQQQQQHFNLQQQPADNKNQFLTPGTSSHVANGNDDETNNKNNANNNYNESNNNNNKNHNNNKNKDALRMRGKNEDDDNGDDITSVSSKKSSDARMDGASEERNELSSPDNDPSKRLTPGRSQGKC